MQNLQQNISLSNYSTMRLGGPAAYLTEVTNRMEVLEALTWAQSKQLPVLMIGSGSNIVWRDEGFPGLIIVDKIMRFEVFDEDESNTYITVGSGEIWDSVVERSVAAGLTGIETLSLIPGTTGATPVQNVGAYGQEIADSLVTVEAFDTQAGDFINIRASDCGFGYRTSRFKTVDRGRFFITAITLHLMRGSLQPPFYGALQRYFDDQNITKFPPITVRNAVIAIRTSKLPDPAIVRNCGSFFANPVINQDKFTQLSASYSEVPHWPAGNDSVKLSAAWLVEQAGFKDVHDPDTGIATWPTQSLVLVNEHAKTTADLLAFKKKIIDAVQAKFGVTLEQEPELLPLA